MSLNMQTGWYVSMLCSDISNAHVQLKCVTEKGITTEQPAIRKKQETARRCKNSSTTEKGKATTLESIIAHMPDTECIIAHMPDVSMHVSTNAWMTQI